MDPRRKTPSRSERPAAPGPSSAPRPKRPSARPSRLWLGLGLTVTALACASPVERAPSDSAERAESIERLAQSVERIAGAFTNLGRLSAVRGRARDLGLGSRMRSEWIDWFSVQQNVVLEFPGRTSELVYVVAHYDKVDANPLSALSVLANGLLDPLIDPLYLSAGAVDNATGVAVALELARSLAEGGSAAHHTYRILLVGSEESGLRGSRAHVARLSPAEKEALALAIVVDTVGLRGSGNCVMSVSDPEASALARGAAASLGLELGSAKLPSGSSSDFEPFQKTSFGRDLLRGLSFNLIGGLLPQRSWFTGRHASPVLFLSACDLFRAGDVGNRISRLLPLPLGQLHGPRDRSSQVDSASLHEVYAILAATIRDLEARTLR